jgi:hypothetical protein
MLNGVSAARRNRLKPAAVTTSLILASPAWAPSASPTSCDSEAGVQAVEHGHEAVTGTTVQPTSATSAPSSSRPTTPSSAGSHSDIRLA